MTHSFPSSNMHPPTKTDITIGLVASNEKHDLFISEYMRVTCAHTLTARRGRGGSAPFIGLTTTTNLEEDNDNTLLAHLTCLAN